MNEEASTTHISAKAGSVQNSQYVMSALQNKASLSSWQRYVYPVLSPLLSIIDGILAKLSKLNTSESQIIELSSHLKNFKKFIQNSKTELTNVPLLQDKCTKEWNDFATQMLQIVEIDEKSNIYEFCKHHIDSLSIILSSIHASYDNSQDQYYIVNGNKVSRKAVLTQLQKIDEKYEELQVKLNENINGIQASLKNLSRTISESSNVFIYCPSGRDDNELLQSQLKQGISTMLKYVQSANQAVEERSSFHVFSYQSKKDIQEYFSRALKEEAKMNQILELKNKEEFTAVTSSITNSDVSSIIIDSEAASIKQKSKDTKKKPQTLKSHSPPKHTPVSRPKLYEERRRVSAIGSLRPKMSPSKA